jgi:hypothetical protein
VTVPNYDQLNSGVVEQKTPDDGVHKAILDRAALVETRTGKEMVVTEWRDATDELVQWQSWNQFEGQGFAYVRDLLLALGVPLGDTDDRGTPLIMDDEGLRRYLEIAQGGMYDVKTQSREVGDRVFVNTYVNGLTTGGAQLGLSVTNEPDVPIDNGDLPAAGTQAQRAAQQFGDPPPF